MDKALKTIPDALSVLKDQRNNLADALDSIGKFSALVAVSTNQTKASLVPNSRISARPAIARRRRSCADPFAGLLHHLPVPQGALGKWMRGDYANLTAIIDLTLSRIDSSLFTGTRFEGQLTELEMQWGRTIGVMPSPYTARNPFVVPYVANRDPDMYLSRRILDTSGDLRP